MIKSVSFTTKDNLRVEQIKDVIYVHGDIGGYRSSPDCEEFFYYADEKNIAEDVRLQYECRIREVIAHLQTFWIKVNEI